MQGHISHLLKLIGRLPGINQRMAKKICFALLYNKELLNNLVHTMQQVQEYVTECSNCGMYTENQICAICSNPERDRKNICIVSDMMNLLAIEKTKIFKGVYHILNGVISTVDHIGPEDLNIAKLITKIKNDEITHILIGLSPTVEGQTTGYYLRNILSEFTLNIQSLGIGVSIGSDLEYLDPHTIAASIKNRSDM